MAELSRLIARGAHRRGGTMIGPSLLMTLVEASRFRESSRRQRPLRRTIEAAQRGSDRQEFKLRAA